MSHSGLCFAFSLIYTGSIWLSICTKAMDHLKGFLFSCNNVLYTLFDSHNSISLTIIIMLT
ncbi:uncharacterized protein DS421_13g396270 [Arachis hypogaea]|nr:uncharacterized protein DS421_13g396270 [Arachis hypogaea]